MQPDPDAREKAMASREAMGGYLADRRWMTRVLDQTYDGVGELATIGRYPFPVVDGQPLRRGVQGPEYMRRMRIMVRRAGVRILDHSPVTELLTDAAGAVAGAAGHRLQMDEPYRVRAASVVLATGGCAFLSGTLGCHVNTGDGHLMAAELGAELSGMEFSNAYAIAPRVHLAHQDRLLLLRQLLPRGRLGARRRGQHPRPLGHRPHAAAREGVLRAGPGRRRGARPDAARPAQLLPHLRPDGHRPVHPALPRHDAAGRHGARHRRHPRRRRRLRHLRPRSVRRR
ncbi:FAD-binding protein [Nonomuraea ferruginea]